MRIHPMGATAAALLAGIALGATPAGDLKNDPDSWYLEQAARHQQQLKFISYSPTIGNVAQITMRSDRFHFAELMAATPLPLAANAAELTGTLRFDLFCDRADLLESASVRLVDSSGQIFQYKQRLAPYQGQWTTVAFSFPEAKPSDVWGGKNDRKIHYPLYLRSFTIDVKRNFTQPITLLIDQPDWQSNQPSK